MYLDNIDHYEVDIPHGASMKLIYLVQRGNSFFVPNSYNVPLQPGLYDLVVEVTCMNGASASGKKPFRITDTSINLMEFSWENITDPQPGAVVKNAS